VNEYIQMIGKDKPANVKIFNVQNKNVYLQLLSKNTLAIRNSLTI